MGLGDFLDGVGDAVTNVAKGAAWVANPTHWDDIAEGAGKAAEFVTENPGKAWDTAFEVGRAVVKDQLDPVNLAINAGLLAATVATGGAAAPAFIAKLGMGAKSVSAGVGAAKGLQAAGTVVKGAKAIETAGDVVGAVKTGAKVVDTVGDVARTADTVTDAAKTGSRVMRGVDKALGMEPGRVGKGVSNVLNPLENSRFGMAAMRERGAARMLEAGGEAPGLARQVGAAVLQGGGRGAGGPAQLAGMSDKVYAAQKMAARAGAVGKRAHQLDQFGQGVEVAADPMGYATEKAYEEADRQGIGRDAGYTDRGHTTESLYGNASEQLAIGPSTRQSAFTAGTGQLAIEAGSQVGSSPYANTATSASGAGGAPPSSTSTMASATPSEPGKKRMEGWSKPGTVQNPPVQKGGWKPSGQHFWEGTAQPVGWWHQGELRLAQHRPAAPDLGAEHEAGRSLQAGRQGPWQGHHRGGPADGRVLDHDHGHAERQRHGAWHGRRTHGRPQRAGRTGQLQPRGSQERHVRHERRPAAARFGGPDDSHGRGWPHAPPHRHDAVAADRRHRSGPGHRQRRHRR